MTSSETTRRKLIILSTSYWNSPLKFRRHQFATIASQNDFDVYYVNPTFSIFSFFQDEDCRKIFFDFFKRPYKVNEHLQVISMPPLLPFQRKLHSINVLNRIISGKILNFFIKKHIGQSPFVFMVYEPTDYFRLVKNKNSIIVYECVDEHSEYPFNLKIKDKLIEIEKKLIYKSDLLSVSSNYLLEKKKEFHANFVLTPNGVDFNLFNAALDEKTSIPDDIIKIKSPVILYVGAIMEWFDYELVIKIATGNKNWNIVLIGPQTVNPNLFKAHSNIHVLGVKQQSSLPDYLKKSTVCIIPFLVNGLVKGVNPLKLYEYMAAGKPVVSTALPDVERFERKNIVHIGRTHDEFISHLDHLINHSNEELIKQRTDIAKEFSWENIYKKLFDRIKLLYKL
jgi:glycosyltransferase involved in cell wall biosynthesis